MRKPLILAVAAILLFSLEAHAKESPLQVISKIFKKKSDDGGRVSKSELLEFFNKGGYFCYLPPTETWLFKSGRCKLILIPDSVRSDYVDVHEVEVTPSRRDAIKTTLVWKNDMLCYEKGFLSARAGYMQLTAGRDVNRYIHRDLREMTRISSDELKELNESNRIEGEGRDRCFATILKNDGVTFEEEEYINGKISQTYEVKLYMSEDGKYSSRFSE